MILGIGFNQLHANSADYEMSVDLGLGYRYEWHEWHTKVPNSSKVRSLSIVG